MSCDLCVDVIERFDVPHVVKTCSGCGRELHVVVPGDHGIGLRVEAGERICIPEGWLQFSANPLQSRGMFTRYGLESFVASFFLEDLHKCEESYRDQALLYEQQLDAVVNSFPPLEGLDINSESDIDRILEVLQDNKSAPAFWAFWSASFMAMAREAIDEGNAVRAAWATAVAERTRSMLVFKQGLEDVVWMGHSVGRVLELIRIWDSRRDESDEEFWQITFNENSYALSQVFAIPVVFIKDKAYVGGMNLERSDARFVDYLFSTESSQEAVLVEIKTPVTRLLGRRYRGTYPPSRELAGAIAQVLDYRTELSRNLASLQEGTPYRFNAFSPRCAVIVGNAEAELTDDVKRRAFELFRASLKDIEIVTYDELFRKVAILVELFGLKREPA